MTRITAVADPSIADLDLHAEAQAMAETVAALQHAREHFAKVRGVFNRQACELHLISADRIMSARVRADAYERQQATRLVEQYRAEALGALMKSALGVDRSAHIHRMAQIATNQRRREQYRERVAERAAEAAAYAGKSPTVGTPAGPAKPRVKVTDRSLIAEVRNGRHSSLNALADHIGLSASSVSVRLRGLVTRGTLEAEEVPWQSTDKGATDAH